MTRATRVDYMALARGIAAKPARKEPELLDVLLVDIQFDERYQRPPIPTHVDKIARSWDDLAAGLVTANIRDDNTIYGVDGQHRVLAAIKLGKRSLKSYAYYGLTLQEEARLFLYLNRDRRAHTAVGRWRAELIQGDPVVARIDQIVREKGLKVAVRQTRGRGSNATTVACPDTLLTIAQDGRGRSEPDYAQVGRVLDFVIATWPGQEAALASYLLNGVDGFLRRYAALLDPRHTTPTLSRTPAEQLMSRGRAIAYDLGIRPSNGMIKALQRAYDAQRRGPGRLEIAGKDGE